ncbi:Leucine-rich repeat,Leucine-rich repeat domain, L domain-like,Leucine-rich repeat, typical subtype [Cinara cedri]|uniref:Leucine-rich repeat,Leucine-rich repeat domain, L domain-like,Leucine-rich repeat, typical subtype n=1 Tax=Cinara cedri TaxID=506608 RepID=A0A5E4NR63_9HEMI|nr:Leucine-rich repeat,Leucine-rich repeat domain, L domain-like,Leucine-rich repeat, typical subtype [Cinara cedri]
MVAIINAIVVPLLFSIVVGVVDFQKECALELPSNGWHDIYCDVIPYKVDLSHISEMTNLDVSQNNLNAIYIASDKNLTLSTLDLSKNNILNSCNVLTSSTVRVRSTILSFNKINNFSMCLDTANLTLSWNHIKSLNKADMVNVSSLEILDLGYNFILWIENDTFVGMPNLQWLNLKGNALTMISEKTLPSTTLLYLDVSENYDLDRSTVFEPFENLVELNIARNVKLAPVVLGSGPRLQALDASHTNLTEIPVTPAPLLGSLILSGNMIRVVNSGDLDGFPLLHFLNISGNRIKTVEDDAFGRLDLLTVLDLCGNMLETVPKSLPGSLETLNLEDNKIQYLEIEDFDGCKRLKTLNVRKNNIRHIQDLTFASLVFLDVLDISENPIKMITREMLTGPVRLKVLKLESLAAPETPTFPFTDTRYLNRIQLAHSKHLAAILLNDSAVLSSMFQLDYLDLTGCAVYSLPTRLPYYMPKMKTLIVQELKCFCSWLKDWLCEIHASAKEYRHPRTNQTELRLRNFRQKKLQSSVESVQCTRGNGKIQQVFDVKHCATIVTTSTYRITINTNTTEYAAVFARLRAKDLPKNTHAVVEPTHPGMIVFVCVVFLLVILACGTVWIGIRGDALKRLQWRQNSADVDYQTIEIKSLESLNHVERW